MLKSKKSIQLASFLILFVMIFNTSVSIASDFKRGVSPFVYEDQDETILIDYLGSSKNITIPSSVKIIKHGALKDKQIESLKLNEGLEHIEDDAFSNNKIQGRLELPGSLKEIGNNVFSDNKIKEVDLSKLAQDVSLGHGIFQDNEIENILGLSNLKKIPNRMFMNNNLKNISLSKDLELLGREAFVENRLTEVKIPSSKVNFEEDVFASNGQYVVLYGNDIKSSYSEYHSYGHIVNPINIIIRSVEKQENGSLKRLKEDQEIKFDVMNKENFFSLNEKSYYEAEEISGYSIDNNIHKDKVIEFTPDKDNFILNVYYTKNAKPEIEVDRNKLEILLKDKKEGDNITNEELLSAVKAYDYLGDDISKDIKVSPKEIINAEAKEYKIIYTVMDKDGASVSEEIIVPIAIDPGNIKIADTEWQLKDFIYNGDAVIGLSEEGKRKAKLYSGIAIPHLNPDTMEVIKIVDFGDKEKEMSNLIEDISSGPLVFGDRESIEKIEDYSFKFVDSSNSTSILLNADLKEMPNLKYVGEEVFLRQRNITGNLRDFPKLEHIGKRGFYSTKLRIEYDVTGNMNTILDEETNKNLRYVGDQALSSIMIVSMPSVFEKLEYVGKGGFATSSIEPKFFLTYFPELRYVGDGGFHVYSMSASIMGFPKIEHIGNNSFASLYFSFNYGIDREYLFKDTKNLKYIGDNAFRSTSSVDLTQDFTTLPNLEYIGDSAFPWVTFGGSFQEQPKLRYIGKDAFKNAKFKNNFPKLNSLEYLGEEAFEKSNFTGMPKELPNLKYVGSNVFGKETKGQIPSMPMIETIESSAFSNTNISGELSNMPKLKELGDWAFRNTNINGPLPEMDSLEKIGRNVFENTNINKDKPLFINNNVSIDKNSFLTTEEDGKQVILLTHDGKGAPNVSASNYHILNPYNIGFIGKNTDGDIIIDETRVLATDNDNKISFITPNIEGYFSGERIEINNSSLENGVYTHTYKTIEEYINDNGGNSYQFTFEPTNLKVYYNSNETINSYLYFSTANEEILKDGKILLKYDKNIYKDFFIPEVKGIETINYKNGEIEIKIEDNISQGTEIGLPVAFQFKEGVLPEDLFQIKAYLYDEDSIKAYGDVEYGVNYKEPSYKSVFNSNIKSQYENIIVENFKDDYKRDVRLNPKTSSFIRDFNSFRVEYDGVYYNDKHGNQQLAELLSPEWKVENGKYVFEVKDYNGEIAIPPLDIRFNNPETTERSFIIKSKVIADVNTKIEDYKNVLLEDENELTIFVEERYGEILIKSINNPHSNNRQAYFFDNDKERNHEFKWNLSYNILYDIGQLIIKDHGLDERMKYTSVIANGDKVNAHFYDKDGTLLFKKIVSDVYQIDEEVQEDIAYIELHYINLKKGSSVDPVIGTKLIDPNKKYYSPENINNENRFMNYMETIAITEDKIAEGKDFAFIEVVKDNYDLKTEVSIVSKPVDLSYGKTAKSTFSLKSKDYMMKKFDELKYTVLINPGHRVEDIYFYNNLYSDYEITKTNNGYTKIDFTFEDIDLRLLSDESEFYLMYITTTPNDKTAEKLEVHGFLSPSEEFDIYGQGKGILEGLDRSKFSYDKAEENIINGEFFSIQKLIRKNDKISKKIETKPNEEFFYRFEIDNGTRNSREEFVLIDVLPFEKDFNGSAYHNKFNIDKIDELKIPEGFEIEYLNQDTFIKNINKYNYLEIMLDKEWSKIPAENTKAIKLTAKNIPAKGDINIVEIPMKTKEDLAIRDNSKSTINMFAYTHKTLGYKQALSNPVIQIAKVETPKKDIKLQKVSMMMGEKDGVLENIRFVLKNSLGQTIASEKTDVNGELVFKDIPAGDYTIEEIGIPVGYKNNPVKIDVKVEDMLEVSKTLDLGEIENHRIDKFDFVFKNVALLKDVNTLNYPELKDIYSMDIKGGTFNITNIDTQEVIYKNLMIDDRLGVKLNLSPGKYSISQNSMGIIDHGNMHLPNPITYLIEIDKFGNVIIGEGKGDNLNNKHNTNSNIIYFPNNPFSRPSTATITKVDQDGNLLEGAEFTLTHIDSGEEVIKMTDEKGVLKFDNLSFGIYSIRETKAPKGYMTSNKIEIIEVSPNFPENHEFTFVNNKIKVNIHKYKVIADNIKDKNIAEDIRKNAVSSTDGNFIIKELDGYYQVREVWKDNKISIDGEELLTNNDGSIYNVQDYITISPLSILDIENNTKIKGHYEPDFIEEHIIDYISKEGFNGVIDIDIEVKPLKGTIYISKYVIDKNNKIDIKNESLTNGAKYTLYVDKGHGFEKVSTKEIDNSNYVVFKDLDPNYSYKVREAYVPEGQEESEVKEQIVELNEINKYTSTVIFRNYIPETKGEITVIKTDGETSERLEGVEFTLMDRNGNEVVKRTNSKGEVVFDSLDYALAPYTLMETETLDGYRLNTKSITITEEDIRNSKKFEIKNYKLINTPETGTKGKLPFIILSMMLLSFAVIFKRKENLI